MRRLLPATVCAVVLTAVPHLGRARTALPPADRALARSSYEELIETNTTHSTGSTTAAAEKMAEFLYLLVRALSTASAP